MTRAREADKRRRQRVKVRDAAQRQRQKAGNVLTAAEAEGRRTRGGEGNERVPDTQKRRRDQKGCWREARRYLVQ